jgi:Cu+-exporting ATPase
VNAFVVLGGVVLIGVIYWWFFLAGRKATAATLRGGAQEISVLVSGGYEPSTIKVHAGQAVRLLFDRRETNPCSEEIVIPAFGIRKFLPTNATTAVEFTPTTPGTFDFSCGMGMLHGRIVVDA